MASFLKMGPLLPSIQLDRVTEDAPILLDVSRLIWRRWKGRLPTGIDRVCLAYLRHFAPRAQAVVHHPWFRGIISPEASRRLFTLLENPGDQFKTSLVLSGLRGIQRPSNHGDGR